MSFKLFINGEEIENQDDVKTETVCFSVDGVGEKVYLSEVRKDGSTYNIIAQTDFCLCSATDKRIFNKLITNW